MWLLAIIAVVVLVAVFSQPKRCDIYGLPFKKKACVLKIGGKKQRVCPKCSNQLERKVGREAIKSKFDK